MKKCTGESGDIGESPKTSRSPCKKSHETIETIGGESLKSLKNLMQKKYMRKVRI